MALSIEDRISNQSAFISGDEFVGCHANHEVEPQIHVETHIESHHLHLFEPATDIIGETNFSGPRNGEKEKLTAN